MDNINTTWSAYDRIGDNIPNLNKKQFFKIEKYIQQKSKEFNLISKFNVGHLIGGIPPKGNQTKIQNTTIKGISYHDVLGGIKLGTRNAELNCRLIDYVLSKKQNTHLVNIKFTDKYVLNTNKTKYKKVMFLPGSNLFNVIDWEKVSEILIDNPEIVLKTHPVTNNSSIKFLKNNFNNKVIDGTNSKELLNHAEVIWTSYNSEIGLIAAYNSIPFGNICKWSDSFKLIYSPVYRHFKYKNLKHNKQIIDTILSSDESGFIFPNQTDYKIRIDNWFKNLLKIENYKEYPYGEII